MNAILKAAGIVIIILFAVLGAAFTAAIISTRTPIEIAFTYDYINAKKENLSHKVRRFQDSAMKNVNKPDIYNKYIDSANKYVDIYNYFK